MSDLEAILFDVDGTLAETEEVHRISFNEAFKRAGLDWVWSEKLYGVLLEISGGKERIRLYLDEHNTAFSRPDDLDGFIAGLHKVKTEVYTSTTAAGGIQLRPGVRRLIEEARTAGVRLAIATTTTLANVEALLTASLHPDSMSWFEVIAAGSMVPDKKPAPDIYEYTLREMKLEPAQCVALEDSSNGLRSAMGTGSGIPTVITVSHYCQGNDFTGAALVVDHLGEPGQANQVIAGEGVVKEGMVDLNCLRGVVGG
ncbi:MAG: HAD family hydrolase [Gammaproteobacteria bacterium]|nr:HAD family hydrolase [Gammaproteobacteria bacterium]